MTRTINRIFNDEEDRQAAALILEGERSTEEFAKIFCLGHLPNIEQRREVKRRKDRIKKRLERDGGESR
jgi:RNA polymerase sigma-70 factor (ECF subfamily)